MGQQRIVSTFPGVPTGLAAGGSDAVGPGPVSLVDQGATTGWTPGATAITPVSLATPLSQIWQIVAWSLTFTPLIGFGAGCAGKIGRLIAGLQTSSNQTRGNIAGSHVPWSTSQLPLPNDATLITPVFDGGTDPAPAAWDFVNIPATAPPITITYPLQIPLSLDTGDSLGFGMWMLPSLIHMGALTSYTFSVLNPQFALMVDDGEPRRQAGWGGP